MKVDGHKQVMTTDRVSVPILIAFGMGGLIPIALFNVAGQLIQLLMNTGLGLSAVALGGILMVPRFWDAFSDPLMGHFSDNAQTPWGRRRPFILVGAIVVAVSFVLMWWGPRNGSDGMRLAYILLWVLLFFTGTTIFEIPHGALGMEMVKEPHVRTRLFSSKSFFGNTFALATPWLLWLASRDAFKGVGGSQVDGMRWVSMLVAVILLPMGVWWFLALKEPAIEKSKSKRVHFTENMKTALGNRKFIVLVSIFFILAMGFNFVGILNYYISMFYLYGGDTATATTLLGINGTVWAITGLIAVFPLNIIGPKLGKRKTLSLSIILMCVAQLSKIVCYNPDQPYLVLIPTVLLSAGMLMFFTLGPSMLGDLCDEVELKTGRRTDGSFYAVFWWFIKMGTACASLVTGLLILLSTFDEKQPSLMDSVVGPLRELAIAGAVEKAGINFNTMTIAVVMAVSGACLALYALKAFRQRIVKLLVNVLVGVGLAAGGGVLGSHLLQKGAEEPKPVNLEEKFSAVTAAVDEADAYFEERTVSAGANSGHYVELRGLLGEIREKTAALAESNERDELELERVRSEATVMIDLSLKAMKQSPTAMFRLRAIEISLPLLMSVISLSLIYCYPLSEKRIYEIKAELERRREAESHG